jgi:hypothetical protein
VSRASIRFRAFHTFSTAQKCPYFLSPMAGRKPTQRIDELEDEIKHRDRRIEELRCEIDELRDLVRMHCRGSTRALSSWAQGMPIVLESDDKLSRTPPKGPKTRRCLDI